jgi:hypothetical protein
MKEWNSRIMVARTIYLNIIKIDMQLVEIYNTHNMVRKIFYTEYMIHKYKNYYFSIYRHRNIDNLPENPTVAVYMS